MFQSWGGEVIVTEEREWGENGLHSCSVLDKKKSEVDSANASETQARRKKKKKKGMILKILCFGEFLIYFTFFFCSNQITTTGEFQQSKSALDGFILTHIFFGR